MSNREKYRKPHTIDRAITVVINGHHESVYLARRKTNEPPRMGDLIYVKSVDITAAPWVLCRVTTVQGDTLPIYHVKIELQPSKRTTTVEKTTPKAKTPPKEIRVKVKVGDIEDTAVIQSKRPAIGETVMARPVFHSSKLPTGWSKYEVLEITTKGATVYHLKLIQAREYTPKRTEPPRQTIKAIKACINQSAEMSVQLNGRFKPILGQTINVRPLKPGHDDTSGPWMVCQVEEIVPLKGYSLYVLSTL